MISTFDVGCGNFKPATSAIRGRRPQPLMYK
jgi:hypothetical protein